jgi:transketolase
MQNTISTTSRPTTHDLELIASQVRRDILRMVHGCQSGHPGGSLGCADLLVALYFQQMKINNRKGKGGYLSFNMDGRGEDLFFLSNGHISPCTLSNIRGN